MRYWQQELWEKFVLTAPQVTVQETEIRVTFLVCYVHDHEIKSLLADDRVTEIRSTPESDLAREELFPFANSCIECRDARQEWMCANRELCEILRFRTTIEEYTRRYIAKFPDMPQPDIDRFKRRLNLLANEMQPGDELWEWDAGGWHRMAGASGLAVVRDGKIKQQLLDRKS